jgi:DNA modification methylase
MDRFYIYNKSSEDMKEVSTNSVDLVIGSPPYNIGTKYDKNNDLLNFDNYKKMLNKIYSECFRVLKKDGILVVELADSIFSQGLYVELAGLVQLICLNNGFNLESRHINFVISSNHIERLENNWNQDYTTRKNAHSNCHQILVFRKGKALWKEGKILYFNYKSDEEHPCPTPVEIYKFLLDLYFKKDDIVLDPFAGTAGLGAEVIRRGGKFIGYETSKKFSDYARVRLSNIKS